MRNSHIPKIILLISGLLLILCLFEMPYAYYQFVRIAITATTGFMAFNFYAKHNTTLTILFAIIGLLFQPLVPVALGRENWLIVDIIVAAIFFLIAIKNKDI